MKVARAAKVQCWITSSNVPPFRLASKLMSKLMEKLAASYKVMCERTLHVSQQPSHFLSLLKRSGTIDSVNMYINSVLCLQAAVPSVSLALPHHMSTELGP